MGVMGQETRLIGGLVSLQAPTYVHHVRRLHQNPIDVGEDLYWVHHLFIFMT